MKLYQIEYDWNGMPHGDVAVLNNKYEAEAWLLTNLPGLEDGDELEVVTCSEVNDLSDAQGNQYAIEHTINDYLTEVREGTQQK